MNTTKPIFKASHTVTTDIIPSSSSILAVIEKKDISDPVNSTQGRFRLFAPGNEKRDMALLLRGDVKVIAGSDVSFFGCLNCGRMSFNFSSKVCPKCGEGSMLYYFDGVYKNSTGMVKVGEKDSNVKIVKL